MNERRLRWGLLGTGRINRAVIPPLRESERHELVAVASRTGERAAAYAAEWGIPKAVAGYDTLLADPDIDVVYVALPNALHAEWTARAARAGKHVLCEKPLVTTREQWQTVADAAGATGVVVAEAFMYRHHSQTLAVGRLVADGQIGEVQLVRGSFTFTLTREGDVRLRPDLAGGSLWDVGCYPVSYARLIVGAEPDEAFGMATMGPTGVDVSFAGQLRFPGGAVAQFDCGFQSPFRTDIEIVGRDGVILVPHPFKPGPAERITVTRAGATEAVEIPGEPLYSGEIDDMADAVQGRRPARVTLADSRGNLAAILALYDSARDRRPVRIEGS
jgi:D-xylose 1-dehydrogenase (NADP+, D-xylono-1,5-lactone-forming)